MYCQHCGKEIQDQTEICLGCGCTANQPNKSTQAIQTAQEQTGNTDNISPKKGTTALILVLLIGTLGIHRFYVKRIGSGIAMALLCIVGTWITIFPFIDGFMDHFTNAYHYGYSDYDPYYNMYEALFSLKSLLPRLAFWLWWLFDLIMICLSKFKDSEGRIVKL